MVAQVKYLGVILDKKLTWKPHIDNKIQNALGVLWLARFIAWICTAIVRPMFSYGCVVWWTRTSLKTVRIQLEHLQRATLRGICG